MTGRIGSDCSWQTPNLDFRVLPTMTRATYVSLPHGLYSDIGSHGHPSRNVEDKTNQRLKVWSQDSERVKYAANAIAGIHFDTYKNSKFQQSEMPLARPTRTYQPGYSCILITNDTMVKAGDQSDT